MGGGPHCPGIAAALQDLGAEVAVLSEHRPNGRGRLERHLDDAGFIHQIGGRDPNPKGHTGLLIASRVPVEDGELEFRSVTDSHRFRHLRVKGWDIACCFIPGTQRGGHRKEDYWRFVLAELDPALRDRPSLLIGDLNTGVHYRDELGATFSYHQDFRELEERGWRDAWTERQPRGRPPGSWWSPRYNNPFRLDHALLSPAAPRSRTAEYPTELADGTRLCGTGTLSDHAPVVITLR
jgi:exonuclease III